MKNSLLILSTCFAMIFGACKQNTNLHEGHTVKAKESIYTCPMHPEIQKNQARDCPICGMSLVEKKEVSDTVNDISLNDMLKPTNEFVLSSIPTTNIQKKEEDIAIQALGSIAYDTRQIESIAARVAGRIEKLYVRYRFQKIQKGDHLMDVYSPALQTAQQNLLFLLQNDPQNHSIIDAAKEKLLLMGMSEKQLQQLIQSRQLSSNIAIYSNVTGHIHDAMQSTNMGSTSGKMKDIALLTEELSLKEGMYVEKGQTIFSVYNPARAWVVLNVFGENQSMVKLHNFVKIVPETAPNKQFSGKIDYIEPFYRKDNKTLSVRVYFDNSHLKIPIGSQVSASIIGNTKNAFWLPKEAVLSLGLDRIVFLKKDDGFVAKKITTGIMHEGHIQVLDGLSIEDAVATDAQYLMDSESFIKVKN